MILDKKLHDSIEKLESKEQKNYELGTRFPERCPLFHSLRFQPLEKLESILQNGYILPGNLVNRRFESYNGDIKNINLYYNDDVENANHGEFISVMPYVPDLLEFDVFIKENLFFVLRGNIPTRETFYLNYSEYEKVMNSGLTLKNLYSYAKEEYFIKEPISIDQIISFGFYSDRIKMSKDDINLLVLKVVDILKYYDVKFDFKDFSSGKMYYSGQDRVIKR